jgi:hypothetical protein
LCWVESRGLGWVSREEIGINISTD